MNWEIRLTRAIEAHWGTAFEWGKNDCCTFTAKCVEAVTGKNYFKHFKNYTSREGAVRALRAAGYSGLLAFLKAAFGSGEDPAAAKRGWILYAVKPDGPTIGICVGRDAVYLGEGQEGSLIFERKETAAKAFNPWAKH